MKNIACIVFFLGLSLNCFGEELINYCGLDNNGREEMIASLLGLGPSTVLTYRHVRRFDSEIRSQCPNPYELYAGLSDEGKAILEEMCRPGQTDTPEKCVEDFFDLSPVCKAVNCALTSNWYKKFRAYLNREFAADLNRAMK